MICVYIFNPTSGKQNNSKNKEYVMKKLGEKFDKVLARATQKRGDAGVFAKQACGYADVIVVSGGDGTMNEVINAIADQPVRPKIGYIPTGTTNDLAHSLKIPKDVKKAVQIILEGHSTTHDIFKANDRYGIYVCAFGVFTGTSYQASQKSKKKLGQLAYFKTGIAELFSSQAVEVKLDFDGGTLSGNYALGIIVNNRYVAGFKVNGMACCNDGYVNVVLIKNGKKKNLAIRAILRIFRLFLFGMKRLKNGKNCSVLKLKKFHVDLPENTTINMDGEAGFNGSFDFEVLEKHVEIFVDRSYK